ncbi:hypothetical protein H4R26_001223 [Coemansia thaxteri]|uniref:W2 domain-containing protein n=1 Tax=Coemansia thaxteri TaxID=2663907 RepID=A0A9W8EKN8_9FUNG|nr:hypothetical protein H4R26_001223 [Coemansia thaxteri]
MPEHNTALPHLPTAAGLVAELAAELSSHSYGIESYEQPAATADPLPKGGGGAQTTLTLLGGARVAVALSGAGYTVTDIRIAPSCSEELLRFVGEPFETLTALLSALSPEFNGAMHRCLSARLLALAATQEREEDAGSRALAKARIDQLTEFFPPNKRDDDCFVRHFEAEDIPALIELHRATQAVAKRDAFVADVVATLRSAKEADEDDDEAGVRAINGRVAKQAKQAMRANQWPETDAVVLAWDGILAAVDWALRPEQIETQAINQIKRYALVLEVLTTEPKSEIALIKHVQLHMYNDPKLTKTFGRAVFELYNADVLSDSAIVFWAAKGARPEGRDIFLKQTEALVRKLEALEDDEEAEEESDDE